MGVGISLDLTYMSKAFELGHCGGELELRNLGLLANFEKPSLVNLYNYFTGQQVKEKHYGGNNWVEELSDSQLDYVIMDAYMSYKIGKSILKGLLCRLKNNGVNIIKHVPKSLENYVSRLNEYSQSLNLGSFPEYKSIVLGPQNVQISCEWKEMTEKTFTATGVKKMDAKQECARQMLELVLALKNI